MAIAHAATEAPVRHWIGVDGGGTRTRARLCDGQGRVLGEGQAGPSALGQGVEQAWRHVRQAVDAALQQAGVVDFEWAHCGLGLGLSGALQQPSADAFLQAAPRCARLVLDSDAWTGLLGAHGGDPGALIIAGTGSVGFAHWGDGQRHQVGGWGWRLGDEGSGAWLGQAVVRHAERALDGRDTRGALAEALYERLGNKPADLLVWQTQAAQGEYAALAPLVFEAEQADAKAAELLRCAVQELLLLAQALDPQAALPVACSGSIALRLSPRLRACSGGRRWTQAKHDALAGALYLAQAPQAFGQGGA